MAISASTFKIGTTGEAGLASMKDAVIKVENTGSLTSAAGGPAGKGLEGTAGVAVEMAAEGLAPKAAGRPSRATLVGDRTRS